MADWEEWQKRWQPRVTLPGKVEGKRLSVRMTAAADRTNRVMLYFAGQVKDLEAIKAPIFYQSVAGGAIIGLIVGLVLGVLVGGR